MSAMRGNGAQAYRQKVIHAPDDQALLDRFAAMARTKNHRQPPPRIVADPQRVERDLARLVLSIVELLRKLLERQAVRRVEVGS